MTKSKQPDIMRCWECGREMLRAGVVGFGLESVKWECPVCMIYYSDTGPKAVVRGNKVIKI